MKTANLRNILLLLILLFPLLISCNDTKEKLSNKATIELFTLDPKFNNELDETVIGKISNFTINLKVPANVSLQNLVATFDYTGSKVEVNNVEQISNVTSNDFSSPVVYKVIADNGDVAEYTVTITNNPKRIPRVYVDMKRGFEFEDGDKETYVDATIRIEDIDNYYNIDTDIVAEAEIKGRGNSTWWGVPKKPYRIKLKSKAPLLDMESNRHWVLLAEHFDKTLLRNITAFEISKIAGMGWTPEARSVDYYMNGTYRGVYTLTEHVRVSDSRVNLDLVSVNDNEGEAVTGDYFLELDFHFDELFKFKTKIEKLPIMFKDPEEPTPQQFTYVENYFNKAEEVLYSDNFLDPVEGYRKYIDVPSFINYYIIQELAKNVDGNMRGSCYISLRHNGKIEMPVIWDFDIAFGNAEHIVWEQGATSSGYDGWFIKTHSPWFDRFFQDPEFVSDLKVRWNELKPQLKKVPDFIKANAEALYESQERNYSPKPHGAGWDITKKYWDTNKVTGRYENDVKYLIDFVDKRIDWLDTNINAL